MTYSFHKALKGIFVLVGLTLFVSSSFAQSGCTDDLACNYDASAVTDDGSCTYTGIFIPTIPTNGPAIRACAGNEPAGYYFADQDCAEAVVAADPFCINPLGSWDNVCEGAYNDCIGCESPQWYLPYDINSNLTAVEACFAPPGYYLAPDQACAVSITSQDSYCIRINWDYICQNDYDLCNLGCLGNWHIPIDVGTDVVVYACEAPSAYTLADQFCIENVIENDDYCVETAYDGVCENAYGNCLYGCTTNTWFLPYQVDAGLTPVYACSAPAGYYQASEFCLAQVEAAFPGAVNSEWTSSLQDAFTQCTLGCASAQYYIPIEVDVLPAVFSCTDPGTDYYSADQTCMQEIIANNPECLETVWDQQCQNDYNFCAAGCAGARWRIPLEPGTGPAVLACSTPEGYWIPNQECVLTVIGTDSDCLDNIWDLSCQNDFEICLNGCTGGTWYIPEDVGTGPAVLACTPPDGYVAPISYDCFFDIVYNDAFCTNQLNGAWDNICNNAYLDCISGCTYAFACNYDPTALVDDGSCNGYPGCTDPTALNYNANAACDDGLCVYDGGMSCPGDLDGNMVINANDLLTFLSVFGTTCP